MNFPSIREKLLSGDAEKRLQSVTDLRERIEIVHTSEFSNFMTVLFPAFKSLLKPGSGVPPQFADNTDNKFRNVLLEIINRLPSNDILKPYVAGIVNLAMEVLKVDNEVNSLICLRIIFDLHKNYRPTLEAQVQPFLDQVKELYTKLERNLSKTFENAPQSAVAGAKSATTPTGAGGEANLAVGESGLTASKDADSTDLLQSAESFKVLTECPLIVMLLFQLYGQYIDGNIPDLIPLMMKALTLNVSAAARKAQRLRYTQFLACQVKTLSFLTYLLRGFARRMRTYEESIGSSVIKLLEYCPPEAVSIRKELLVATRHILATDFKKGFYNHVDKLSDEKILIGSGRASNQVLRPLAYSTLADLVHHVRNKLSLHQLSNIIYLFCRNLNDSTLPTSIQTTSVRLLLNLVDFIYHNQEPTPTPGRNLLVRILNALVGKFGTLRVYIPKVIASDKVKRKELEGPGSEGALDRIKRSTLYPKTEGESTPSDSSSEEKKKRLVGACPEVMDSIKDVLSLIRTMVLGLKTVIWCLTNYRRPPDFKNKQDVNGRSIQVLPNEEFPLQDDEGIMISKFFKWGMQCFLIYAEHSDLPLSEEKEVLDHFAGAFTALETPNFVDLFIKQVPHIFNSILREETMITLPQHFLANIDVSSEFAEILLDFLVQRLGDLSGKDDDQLEVDVFSFKTKVSVKARSLVILNLFKIIFGSVTLFPENEAVAQPHLKPIVAGCLRKAMEMKTPTNYYLLLRALFRSMSGRKLELFNKEFQPILPGLLSGLIRLQSFTINSEASIILLELCLTVPARLSSLLQYLPLLMRPLVSAINSEGQLVNVGLRTLEFWVDNLNPEFFFPIMSGQDSLLTDLIESLCKHLHPPPYQYGMLAMRLLGKLGGRNRRFLKEPLNLDYIKNRQAGLSVDFLWNTKETEDSKFSMPMDFTIDRVCNLLTRICESNLKSEDVNETVGSSMLHHKRQGLKFLTRSLTCILQTSGMPDPLTVVRPLETASTTSSERLKCMVQENLNSEFCKSGVFPDEVRNVERRQASRSVILKMLRVVFKAVGDVDIGKDANEFLRGLVVHFCLVIVSHSKRHAPFDATSKESESTSESAAGSSSCLPSTPTSSSASKQQHAEVNLRSKSAAKDLDFESRIRALSLSKYGDCELLPSCDGLDIFILNEVTVESMCDSEQAELKNVAYNVLEIMSETISVLCESSEAAAKQGGVLFGNFVNLCIHACYGKCWKVKVAGCRGIRKLSSLLHRDFIMEHHLICLKAMLFVLADHEPETTSSIIVEVGISIDEVLEKCFGSSAEKMEQEFVAENLTDEQQELLKIFCMEIINAKRVVRDQVKKSLVYLAKVFGCTVSQLIEPYQERLCELIFATTLRQLPPDVQVGYIDAVSYGLVLDRPVFTMNDELVAFLLEVWYVTLADDPSSQCIAGGAGLSNMLGDISAGQLYPCELPHSVCLRLSAISCVRAAFVTSSDTLNKHEDARNKFVSIFFRSLTAQPDEVVEAAQGALADIIALNKQAKEKALPKELLQACLRPVLLNLADYRKLSLPLLKGLARLLMLLSSCFNVTLGEKLLEHLRQWEDPVKIKAAKIWHRGEEPKVAAAIVNLFHLLPPSETFLSPLLNCVLKLEDKLLQYGSHGKISSPFRLPLTLFLNRYASQSVHYFLKRDQLLSAEHSSLFLSILRLPEAKPLRDVLTGEGGAQLIMTATFVAASKLSQSSNAASEATAKAESSASGSDMDAKLQAQIQANAAKAHSQAISQAQAQGLSPMQAQNKAKQAQAAYIAKAQAQVSAQQASKAQTQVNAQKVHAQALAAAQSKGLSPAMAQMKAKKASSDYIAKMQLQMRRSPIVPVSVSSSSGPSSASSQFVQAQIQANAQKVYSQTLVQAQTHGATTEEAQERAKQAQTSYVQRANMQAQVTHPTTGGASTTAPAPAASPRNPAVSSAQLNSLELHFQGLKLVRLLSRLDSDWLSRQKIMVDCLRKLWRSSSRLSRLMQEERLQLRHQQETKLLVKCLIIYCRVNPEDVQVLFDLLTVFLQRSLVDFTFLKDFYRIEVSKSYSTTSKKAIVKLFLRMLQDATISEESKVQALQLLVLPMLAATFEDKETISIEVVDNEIISAIMRDVLGGKLFPDYGESLRIELLQLATLLIEHMGDALLDHRKELIKFAWNHLKSEDTTSKQWAYVNVCRFIQIYETPPKIILQVYVALLRTYQNDARDLVRSALDILTPSLPKRLPSSDFIKAIKWTKKIIYEEGHAIQQLAHIWHVLVRQPSLFYGYRAQFVPQMVNSLNRLALPPNCPVENRKLAVSLVDLIISWDRTRRLRVASSNTSPEKKRELSLRRDSSSMDTSPAVKKLKTDGGASPISKTEDDGKGSSKASSVSQSNPGQHNDDEFRLNSTMVDMIVNFLVRFSLSAADIKETEELSLKCVDLISIALEMWPNASLRFQYFDKLISFAASDDGSVAQPNGQRSNSVQGEKVSLPTLKVVLKILNLLLSDAVLEAQKDKPFVLTNIKKLQLIIDACFDIQEDELQFEFQKFVLTFVRKYPSSLSTTHPGVELMYDWFKSSVARRCLNALLTKKIEKPKKSMKGYSEQSSDSKFNPKLRSSADPCVQILQSLYKENNGAPLMEHFVAPLLKLSQKLHRDHLQAVVVAEATKEPTLEGSTGGAQVGVNAGLHSRDFVMATPTLSLLAPVFSDRYANELGASGAKPPSFPRNGNNSSAKQSANSDLSVANRSGSVVDTLVNSLDLLFDSKVVASEHKKGFMQILLNCLEKSRYIPLLIAITKIVGKLMDEDSESTGDHDTLNGTTEVASTLASETGMMVEGIERAPILSQKDKTSFLSKMSLFDRLNEVEAQELLQLHRELILKLSVQGDSLGLQPAYSLPHIGGPFMVSLMSPNVPTRKRFFDAFVGSCSKGVIPRLQFIFSQDWMGCGTRLWTVTAVEILLSAIHPGSVPHLSSSCEVLPVYKTEDTKHRLPTAVRTMLSSHSRFLEETKHTTVSQLIQPLRDLLHLDVDLVNHLWTFLFPLVWSGMDEEGRLTLSTSLTELLTKRYHRRRIMLPELRQDSCNVVSTILQGVALCHPQPALPAELLLFLAKTYNAWHYVLPICEHQVLAPVISDSDRERWVSVLSSLYKELSQDDLQMGLSYRFSVQPETRLALSLEGHGLIKEAQEMYFKAMCRVHSNRITSQLSKFEMKVWEERWVDCSRQLNQWQLLTEFAKSVQNQELLMEAAWKRGDWLQTRQLLSSVSIQASTEAGCPETRLKKLYIAIHEGQKPMVEHLTTQTMHLALHKWKSMPSVLSRAHVPMLHLFHKFSELQESAQMMVEMQTASQQKVLPDFKNTLTTWRERLPNKWDSILLWDDILTWRSHMFQVITNTFNWADAQHLACMHDNPWSVIKLAHTARKQNLGEVCLSSLTKLYGLSTMDVQDAFCKLREQVIICSERPTELRGGLNIINNTNLDYFNSQQKAELFRLKAKFLDALGGKNEANQSFSHCLQICDSYAKGWLSWGLYCDRLFQDQNQIEFAVQAMACYLQAVHHRSSSARLMLSRVLWLLSMDDHTGNLAHAFEAHGKQLPIWIWIIWIPQLLTALSRPEAPQVRGLLRGVAAKFPQALYYTIRAFLLEKREIPVESSDTTTSETSKRSSADVKSAKDDSISPTSSSQDMMYIRTRTGNVVAIPTSMTSKACEMLGLLGQPRTTPQLLGFGASAVLTLDQWKVKLKEGGGGGSIAAAPVISSVQYTEDLMGFLRRSHQKLAFELEAMLEEVIVRFRPHPEEELLSALHALLLKCYQLPIDDYDQPMPVSLKTTLERVSRKFFTNKPDVSNAAHDAFIEDFKGPFHEDFCISIETSTLETKDMLLRDVVAKLRRWKHVLLWQVKKSKTRVFLEQCSRQLVEFGSRQIEIPGQYIADKEPMTDLHIKLHQFSPAVKVMHRNGFSQRRLGLVGHNGRTYSFLIQFAIPHTTRTDERVMQLHLLFNQLLSKHSEANKRDLCFHIPLVIPITPRVRIMEDNDAYTSLGEVYELDCIERKIDIELPITKYKEAMKVAKDVAVALPTKEETNLSMASSRLAIYKDICENDVDETILSQYLHSVLPSMDHYFHFRNEFASQLALSSFLQYILSVGERAPHKIAFSKETGRLLSTVFRPCYNAQGLLASAEPVPFRLSRNLHSFVTNFSIEGPFSNALTAAAHSLSSRSEVLENQLSLFFRDDLLSWHIAKAEPRPESELAGLEATLSDRVSSNVKNVIEKVNSIAPSLPAASEAMPTFQAQRVFELIEVATDPTKLCQMGPTWFPWL